ncbi:MAG: hypothetical protein Kow0099_33020 [Candidatus Abyssubacteria bacterium]
MRKLLAAVTVSLVFCAVLTTSAYAGDEFEKGFKWELGAITARSAVGLGVGVINVGLGGPVRYDGHYVKVIPVRRVHPRPVYRETIVYTPCPPPVHHVERVVYVTPPPPPPPPRPVYTYEYHYYGYR